MLLDSRALIVKGPNPTDCYIDVTNHLDHKFAVLAFGGACGEIMLPLVGDFCDLRKVLQLLDNHFILNEVV